MIPASARFVQVGAFADDANATIVIRRLSEMGYRVGQTRSRHDGKPVRVILAGPFTDRRSLVAALNRLRAQGYPGAVAR
nr:SPOR domain-containing protein [Paracoccus marinaquae]